MLIYGCAANEMVPAKSKISKTFFEMLERAKAENDCILIPDASNVFNSWIPNDDQVMSGEKVIKTTKPLHFYGPYPQSI